MIVDTSALIAVLRLEPAHHALLDAMLEASGFIPSPVIVEFKRVSALRGNLPDPDATVVLEQVLGGSVEISPFTADDALLAAEANESWGSGKGRGGPLNMLDLMVYAVAKRRSLPILCTGRDFAATDALIHPASRVSG